MPTFDDFTEEAWYVHPTRLALYRDAAGNLISKIPPPVPASPERAAVLRKLHPGVKEWSHPPPIAAWRPLSVEENWGTGNCFDVDCGSIRLGIGPRTLELSCGLRWWTFLAESAMQAATRRICHEVARVVGSPQALYLSERLDQIDAIIKGATVAEIVAEMSLEHGPPELRLRVFPEDATLDAVGGVYYLDNFAGL